MNSLEAFFSPKVVAIVGVSDDPSKIGSVIFNNMIDAGFSGKLYPINPKHKTLYYHEGFPKVSDIPEKEVDLVCIVVPAQFVLEVMQDCALKKVKAVVIITAGFKEIGEEGAKLENSILEIAKKNNIRIIGPNCLGYIVPKSKLNVSFAAATPAEGNIAFISQSGAFCTGILDMAIPNNLGFSHFVSVGNKCDVDEFELIDSWMKDDDVKVIGAYLEELKYGQEFLDAINRNSEKLKPVIIYKPGKSDEAKKAISSHTGSIAGSLQTFQTAMSQNGVIEANSIRGFFNLISAFSRSKLPKGPNVGIITNAGGPGIIATDKVIESGLKIAVLNQVVQDQLKKVLPNTANVHNPVDVIGDALADRYSSAIEILGKDPNVDSILIILTPQLVTQIEDTAKVIINAIKTYDKPILPVFIGDKYITPGFQRISDQKLNCYRDIDDAIEVLSAMLGFQNFKLSRTLVQKNEKISVMSLLNRGHYKSEIKNVIARGIHVLPDEIIDNLINEVGLEGPKQKVCFNIDEAKLFADPIYPVVIKATNDVIAHKTDFKALYLDIYDPNELEAAFKELALTINKNTGKVDPGILIQEQLDYKQEFFIGANRDGAVDVYDINTPGFGHLIAFGQGGIYTEIYKDIRYCLVPTSEMEVQNALKETKIFEILNGARGKEPLAIDKIIDSILAVQKLLLLYPEIVTMDINPVLITKDRAVSVDIKIFV